MALKEKLKKARILIAVTNLFFVKKKLHAILHK